MHKAPYGLKQRTQRRGTNPLPRFLCQKIYLSLSHADTSFLSVHHEKVCAFVHAPPCRRLYCILGSHQVKEGKVLVATHLEGKLPVRQRTFSLSFSRRVQNSASKFLSKCVEASSFMIGTDLFDDLTHCCQTCTGPVPALVAGNFLHVPLDGETRAGRAGSRGVVLASSRLLF